MNDDKIRAKIVIELGKFLEKLGKKYSPSYAHYIALAMSTSYLKQTIGEDKTRETFEEIITKD